MLVTNNGLQFKEQKLIEFLGGNNKALRIELDLIEQAWQDAVIMTKVYKQCMTWRFNSKLAPWQFEEGDLVWKTCRETQKVPSDGKLAAN